MTDFIKEEEKEPQEQIGAYTS